MNYQERITALSTFKSAVSSGTIEDTLSSHSTDIADWIGGSSKSGYETYMTKVKTDAKDIVGKKDSFLGEIDTRIAEIQGKFDREYSTYSGYLNSLYDKDATKKKEKKLKYYNSLKIDSSVKAKLAQNCLN